jgi:hypothetical protein
MAVTVSKFRFEKREKPPNRRRELVQAPASAICRERLRVEG